MICNDMDLANEILERKARAAATVAFEADGPLWKSVDTEAPVWGLRRFPPGQKDPTSPLGGAPEVLQHYKDPGALGMTFVLKSNSLATVT